MGAQGRSWEHLGAPFGLLRTLLGPLCSPLDPSWKQFGLLGMPKTPSRKYFLPKGIKLEAIRASWHAQDPFQEVFFTKRHQISSKNNAEILNFIIVLLQICCPLPPPTSPIPFPPQDHQSLLPSNPPSIQASKGGRRNARSD